MRFGQLLVLNILLMTLASCATNEKPLPITDHYDGEHFYNPIADPEIGPMPYFRWKLVEHSEPWPSEVQRKYKDKPPKRVYGEALRITFVGHATVLIQTQGVNILTDPVWSDHIGINEILSDKRVIVPGIDFNDLPEIDIVLLSHNHYDHLDLPTMDNLWKKYHPLIIVPLRNGEILKKYNPAIRTQELDWHESLKFNNNITIYLEPSQHWSEHNLMDTNKALWGSYVIETPEDKILFMGDSAYGEGNNYIYLQQKHGNFRLAFLPIGAYEPRWYTKQHHMDPDEAVQAHKDLGEPPTVAIHYATFHLTDEAYNAPEKALKKSRKKYNISPEQFRTLEIGEVWEVP